MKTQNQQERTQFWNAIYEQTPSQAGMAVPKPVAESIADALRTYSAMRRVCTVITSDMGGEMGWPNSDGRNEIGEQLDQNAPSSSLDPSFGKTALPVFKYGSKMFRIPMELWQDACANFPTFIESRIGARIGRITNRKFTIGTGVNEPMGIVGAATVGRIGVPGQTMTVTDDDLEDLLSSVDESYRLSPSCYWMMREETLRSIAKLKDPDGFPLQLVERGADLVQRLKGYPIVINPDMPLMAPGAKSILFGDFSTYVIRDVLQVDIRRMVDSALILNGQIGMIGFARSGGAYVDVGGAIMAYQNSPT
ncbi:phage major capsid protein [Massilia sp. YMA4]|uniref:phage major capsid protein n=1 Tax=Massilia sp. YMA4 TaxID=1593482 RepID=UPI000DD156A8|nr:phage major capsid protein [Massilia sp. YMA4]AXA93571.1 phage major capsid protein [Massilia sp. YMA4]